MKKIFFTNIIIKCVLLIYTSLFLSSHTYGQSPKGTVGAWLMGFNQTRLHKNWSLHAEVQYRSFEIAPNSEQLLLRGGVNYHINNFTTASVGYGRITNYSFDKELTSGAIVAEDRIWQQLSMRNNSGRFFFEHRYRLEQRWMQSKTSTKYLDRIRYLIRVTVPLNKKEMMKNTLFLSFYDEIFIHFSTTPFDRNRLYGAIGYQFLPNANIQVGYLAQTVNITTKQYLQLAVFYNFDFRKKTAE